METGWLYNVVISIIFQLSLALVLITNIYKILILAWQYQPKLTHWTNVGGGLEALGDSHLTQGNFEDVCDGKAIQVVRYQNIHTRVCVCMRARWDEVKREFPQRD